MNLLIEFESESIKLDYGPIILNSLLADICKDFYRAAEVKNIPIQYAFDSNKEYGITGDKDKIKQVFINLISNALKFTNRNGKVLIRLYENNKNIIVEIKDNGMGIKEDDLPFIFERHYRGDKSRLQIEGTGIGLTIVKNILELHFARMEVNSKEWEGTKVKIFFKNEN